MARKTPLTARKPTTLPAGYAGIHGGIVALLDAARRAAARSVNVLMTASCWEIGRRIIEAEQKGKRRAGYGEQLIARLSADLTARFGRGFSADNLENMRRFFLAYPLPAISETASRKLGNGLHTGKCQTVSMELSLSDLAETFTLPWSAYVRLLSVKDSQARQFYEAEALRGGWSVRQLDRQIGSQLNAELLQKALETTRRLLESSGTLPLGTQKAYPSRRQAQRAGSAADCPLCCATSRASHGPSAMTRMKRAVCSAITNGRSTGLEAAMMATESAPPGLVAR